MTYDYWMSDDLSGDVFELAPGLWGDSSDMGNFMAEYAAGISPPSTDTSAAMAAMHWFGGAMNREADKSGAFGDSARSEALIQMGYAAGLADRGSR